MHDPDLIALDPTGALHKAPYHHGDLRKVLLGSAEQELTEKGVEGFTLRGCAKRAGVSHAAPAHHFRDVNGLLTALAAEGFDRFCAAMRRRQALVGESHRDRLVAAGLGYIDFARANPALFRLMFSSFRTDFEDGSLLRSARDAFEILTGSVEAVIGRDPLTDEAGRKDVAAAWALAHGLADLLLSRRMPFLAAVEGGDSDAILADIIARAIANPSGSATYVA